MSIALFLLRLQSTYGKSSGPNASQESPTMVFLSSVNILVVGNVRHLGLESATHSRRERLLARTDVTRQAGHHPRPTQEAGLLFGRRSRHNLNKPRVLP